MDIQEKFCSIYKQHINRPGSEEFLNFLKNESTFFKDPASSKYHLAYPGGLAEHSLHVYDRLQWLCINEAKINTKYALYTFNNDSIAIVGLLHDVCKIGTYKQTVQNFKNYDTAVVNSAKQHEVKSDANGKFIWDQRYVYQKNDTFPFGHGEKSVYLINKYMKLTDEEAMAIRYHMGSWNEWEKNDAGRVYEKYELALLAHMADEFATFVDEV